ncbi:MAG: hypothetical protein JF588_10785 [Caulobacterales bacterium]|nr:hypothetical protein [Caulobacterales bacterium]
MDRRPLLGALVLGALAITAASSALPAAAQTWPAGAVTTPTFAQPRSTLSVPLEAPVWRAPSAAVTAWTAPAPQAPALKPAPDAPAAALPKVKIPAKAAWSDDQGVRLHYAEVVYKQRF